MPQRDACRGEAEGPPTTAERDASWMGMDRGVFEGQAGIESWTGEERMGRLDRGWILASWSLTGIAALCWWTRLQLLRYFCRPRREREKEKKSAKENQKWRA